MLFFDKLLSGNRNIACATCHHPALATGDGLALPLGEGAVGLGPDRRAGDDGPGLHGRVPRNSQPLFNLGAREYTRMFHDGRVEVDAGGHYASGFISPAKWKLPGGLDSVLAAQAMFPVTSPDEMAGQKGENAVADAVSLRNLSGPGGAWELLAQRLRDNPRYVELFIAAFPERVAAAEDIDFVDAANAIAAFEAVAFRSDGSPFDDFLRGNSDALSPAAVRGMDLFYGRAGCARCHAGPFQTDHAFHAIAMPQIGPGKGDGADGSYWRATGERAFLEDFGRGRVTARHEDDYRFRTPSLRNVVLTGPWGHSGAYDSLEAVVRHHLDPVGALERYAFTASLLPAVGAVRELGVAGSALHQVALSEHRARGFFARDGWVQGNRVLRGNIARANELDSADLSDAEVADVLAFLHSLTDARARNAAAVPTDVPSGLAVDGPPSWRELVRDHAHALATL